MFANSNRYKKNVLETAVLFIKKNSSLIIASVILMAVFFQYRFLFFVILFVALDIANSVANSMYKISLPLDFLLMGAIIFSLEYGVSSAMIFLPFILVDKLVLGKLNHLHFIKIPVVLLVIVVTRFLRMMDFYTMIIVLYTLRYAVEYIIQFILFGEFDIAKIPRRIYNYVGALIFFSTIARVMMAFM